MWLDSMFPYMCLPTGKRKKLAEFENNLAFQNEFFKWLNLAMYRIELKNLPETMNDRVAKFGLICGRLGVAQDPEAGVIGLPASPTGGEFNMYGDSKNISLYGYNGFYKEFKCYLDGGGDDQGAEAVFVRDNYFGYPLLNYIIQYSKDLSDTMRTIQVTANKLKTPYFVVCDGSQKASVEEILNTIEFNRDSIITNKSVSPNMFQVLPTNIREGALQALWSHYNNLEGQIRTILGISSAVNQDKRERLVVDEVNADNELQGICLEMRKSNWQYWFDIVNRLFGTDISCEVKEADEYDLSIIPGMYETGASNSVGGGSDKVQDE